MSSSPKKPRPDLLGGDVGPTLRAMAGPNVIGLVAILFFGVVDTMWVGQLGKRELAAMAFSFPVTFVVVSVAIGMGIAMMSGVSRAIGGGDHTRVCRYATDVLALTFVVMLVLGATVASFVDPIFELLGADDEMRPLIAEYMVPYLLGVALLSVPMVGNGALRARGDTRSPALIMVIIGIVNAVLDPFLIFGIGPFPAMGLRGAAIATVFAWSLAAIAEIALLVSRDRMIDLRPSSFQAVLASWGNALYVGIPAAASSMVGPASIAVLTRLVSVHGEAAVAGFGVGGRVEMLAMVGSIAMSIALAPFVGQNVGARRFDRVEAALAWSFRFAWRYGIAVAIVLAVAAYPLTAVFTDNSDVESAARRYFWIVPLGYGAYGVCQLVEATFNAVNRPLRATFLVVVRLGVLAVPLAYVGSRLFGLIGLLAAIPIASVLGALVALASLRRFLAGVERVPGSDTDPVRGRA